MNELKFGNNKIEIYDDHTIIELKDGCRIPAVPHDTEEYRTTAKDHGYENDTMRLCKEHELIHVALANFIGLEESPTMRNVASHDSVATRLGGFEEQAVLALQRYANAAGVNLLDKFTGSVPKDPAA